MEIIQKSRAWYTYKEERLGQGRDNAKQFLKENEHIRISIQKEQTTDITAEIVIAKENDDTIIIEETEPEVLEVM